MRLISLNTFGGKFFEPLMEFVQSQAPATDLFCFQEVLDTPHGAFVSHGARANLLSELQGALPDFDSFFAVAQEHYDQTTLIPENVRSGLATFVKRTHVIQSSGDFFIYEKFNSFVPPDLNTFPSNLHYVQMTIRNMLLTVCNVHGMCMPADKLDSPGRLAQSQKILGFVNQQPGEKIITGDCNLLPHTESIAMFERNGFRNLVKEFSISTTRGSLIKKLHPEYGKSAQGWQEFADYTFVSAGIKPTHFTVPDIPISDHLPLILEFEMRVN